MSGTRWLEVTDTFDPKGTQRGIHTVDADAPLPPTHAGTTYRYITEAEARAAAPALFGIPAPTAPEAMAEQIAELQAILNPPKAAKK